MEKFVSRKQEIETLIGENAKEVLSILAKQILQLTAQKISQPMFWQTPKTKIC